MRPFAPALGSVRARGAFLLMAAMLAAPVAGAQTRPAGEPPDLVVTGRRQSSAEQSRRFVREVVDINTGQLARFIEPVCPLVLGVPASKAGAIVDRMRRVAAGAGIALAPAGCQPNLVAAIAGNADGFIRTARKRHGAIFAELSDVDVRDAFRSGKVHSWRLVEDRDENGVPLSDGVAEATGSPVFDVSRQAAAVHAVVILDRSVVLDKTIAQLADYIAMRALAGGRAPRSDSLAGTTILSLFDGGPDLPAQMTALDRGLLRGLYATPGTSNARRQANQISREMSGGAGAQR